MNSNALVLFRLHFIVLLWGFTGVVGKYVSLSSVPLVWYRMLIGVVTLFIVLKFLKKSLVVNRKELFQLFGIGAIIGVHWLTFFGAIKVSNVAIALSTLSTGSLFTLLIEVIVNKKKVYFYEVLFSVIITACVAVLFNVSPEYKLGIFLGLICSFLSAIFSVYNAKLQPIIPSGKIIFYEMLGGVLLVTVFLFFGENGGLEQLKVTWKDFLALLVLGSVLTVYPMIESVRLMKNISPFTLLLTVNLEPVYGIVLAYLCFGESEKMNWLFYVIALIMIATIVANQWLSKRKRRKGKFNIDFPNS